MAFRGLVAAGEPQITSRYLVVNVCSKTQVVNVLLQMATKIFSRHPEAQPKDLCFILLIFEGKTKIPHK